MVNDATIIFGIIIFFVGLGTIIPIVENAFTGSAVTSNEIDTLFDRKEVLSENETVICLEENFNVIFFQIPFESCYNKQEVDVEKISRRQEASWIQYVTNIGQMFFWTFGTIPFFLELFIFVPIRILLAFLIFRTIRSGAG